ncbi:MAG: acyl-CoA thioesterase [Nakamurella sp.]
MGKTIGHRYVTDVWVRWSDLDAFGHVNNAKTVTLLEEARVDWLFVEAAEKGIGRMIDGIVVAKLHLDYKRSIPFGRPLTISMGVAKLSASSFTVDYLVSFDDVLAATGETMLVPVDPATFRPRRLDQQERDFLTEFQAPHALPES